MIDLDDYGTTPEEYEEIERDEIIKIIDYEMEQWEDYHVQKALGRVRALIEQRDSSFTGEQNND